jgi:isopentenyl-diphosphate delta-isomerase
MTNNTMNWTTKLFAQKRLLSLSRLNIALTANIRTSPIKNYVKIDKQYDQIQLNLLNEQMILVDQDDKPVGCETKKNCHLLENISKGMLHRAFSVFLFDMNNRLLLQQRSIHKITYPNHWTNTCCSHPLYIKEEMETKNNQQGIKVAAKRRLNYELGIQETQLKIDSFNYITRIHYKAENVPNDGVFGEHEIDYILFIKGDFDLQPNANEVKAVRYVSMYELKEVLVEETNPTSGILLTPWFKMISNKFLFDWWSKLDRIDVIKDEKTIHRFV